MFTLFGLIILISTGFIIYFAYQYSKIQNEIKKQNKIGNKIKTLAKNVMKKEETNEEKEKVQLRLKKLKKYFIISLVVLFIGFVGVIETGSIEEANNKNIAKNTLAYEDKASLLDENSLNEEEQVDEQSLFPENTISNEEVAKENNQVANIPTNNSNVSTSNIPSYTGSPYVKINNNVPYFSASDLTTKSYEYYSNLDGLGRCGVAISSIGKDLMPTEKRGEIGSVKPSGWHTAKYDNVDGKYLYNRCHLIGYQLTGENANNKNLITGTRYLNIKGMLPFENMVADYIKETNNHVLYRVTPMFSGNNLLVNGVLMEAESVEDGGAGIKFNVYCYNVQPGININYATGDSSYEGGGSSSTSTAQSSSSKTQSSASSQSVAAPAPVTTNNNTSAIYVLNTSTKKFHKPGCSSAKEIVAKNRKESNESRDSLINQGYQPCKKCNP